jgi:hypothetical protein
MLSLESVVNLFTLKVFRSVRARSEREFMDLIGQHKAMKVKVQIRSNRHRQEFADFYAFDAVCVARSTAGMRVVYIVEAGYVLKNVWSRSHSRAAASAKLVSKARELADRLHEQYHGIDVHVADDVHRAEGPQTVSRQFSVA